MMAGKVSSYFTRVVEQLPTPIRLPVISNPLRVLLPWPPSRWVAKGTHLPRVGYEGGATLRGTMNEKVVTVLVTLIAYCSFACSPMAEAKPITEAEKRHCEEAYHKYCGEYGLESNALRNCMSRNGRSLPHACIEALIDAGEVSRSEVERRKKSGQ